MFTPPPSPGPPAPATAPSSRTRSPSASDRLLDGAVPVRLHRAHRPPSIVLTPPASAPPSPPDATPPAAASVPSPEQRKKRVGARTRLLSLFVVPAVLFLITLSTRVIAHPAALDVLSADQPWSVGAVTNWYPHKRHPQGSGQGQSSSVSGLDFPSSAGGTTPTATSTPAAGAAPTVPAAGAPPVLPTPFPQPFDSTLGQNFSTQGCAAFFANMTQAPAFRSCRPFSLLFHQSAAFINAQTNLTLFNSIIWGTCNTDTAADQCTANMGWFADALQSACKAELAAQNPVVTSAATGLGAYALMRTAGCTANPATDTYCVVDAVHASTAVDIYYFGLPLGTPLPAGTKPTCSGCSKSLLALYAPYAPAGTGALAANATAGAGAPLPGLGGGVYASAAGAADQQCGQTFAVGGKASSARARRPLPALALALGAAALAMAW